MMIFMCVSNQIRIIDDGVTTLHAGPSLDPFRIHMGDMGRNDGILWSPTEMFQQGPRNAKFAIEAEGVTVVNNDRSRGWT